MKPIVIVFFAWALCSSLARASDRTGEIYDAIQHEDLEKARINLAVDSNAVNCVGEKRFTLLHFAAEHGSSGGIEILKLLLSDGARVDARNHIGQTPLFDAVACNNLEGVKVLIAHGAKVNQRQNDGRTVLHWAAVNGDSKMAKILISDGAIVNAKDADGKAPLDFAIEQKERTKDANLVKQYVETIAVLQNALMKGHPKSQ